nr:hypothetical protein [Tanacetum cinerariifolium]
MTDTIAAFHTYAISKAGVSRRFKPVLSKGHVCYRMFNTTQIDEAVAFGAERRGFLRLSTHGRIRSSLIASVWIGG